MPACGSALVPMRTLMPAPGWPGCGRCRARHARPASGPRWLLATMAASATIKSSGAPRWRVMLIGPDHRFSLPSGSRLSGAFAGLAGQAEVVVRAVEGLRLPRTSRPAFSCCARRYKTIAVRAVPARLGRVFIPECLHRQPSLGDDVVELVVAQVHGDRHALQARLGGGDGQRRLVDGHVQRHGRVGAALVQV